MRARQRVALPPHSFTFMKLHLLEAIFRALFTGLTLITLSSQFSSLYGYTEDETDLPSDDVTFAAPSYTKGEISFTEDQTAGVVLNGYEEVLFSAGMYNYYGDNFTLNGNRKINFMGDVYNGDSSCEHLPLSELIISINNNESVSFSGRTILNVMEGSFSITNNKEVDFSVEFIGNTYADFNVNDNGLVSFSSDISFWYGGVFSVCSNQKVSLSRIFCDSDGFFNVNNNKTVFACSEIYNTYTSEFSICNNGDVYFIGYTNSNASDTDIFPPTEKGLSLIYNCYGNFTLSGNGNVIVSGNTFSDISPNDCSAIYNEGVFTLSNNGDVIFEKNAEISNGIYRLRSVYSGDANRYNEATLNLSASENHSILFRDSIYAEGIVNLNQDGTGDIIFSGATTEADLREVKGGIDGTAEEILNSRTSEIATNAKLYGGRLIVEDGAILKGQGITVMENANATIRLNNATLDETGYTIAVSSGSGLELEGDNTLKASSVQLADGATLSFVMGDGNGTDWDAQLVTGQLNVLVSGDLFNEHRLLTLHDSSQYDTSLWTSDAITVSGTTFDSLSWNAGVLTYTPHVIEAEEDGTFDDKLPDNGNAVIDGNGHSLTVKNAVQLVQMALKNGTVKLEGENNNVVSVTLTEDGTLVLTAGAGLKTGDIISMVANGKGELVISGDITLDEHGMKGKNGQTATVSNMSATTTGDAVFENVAFTDSLLDIGEGTTATFKNAVLGAGTRVTDAPATAKFENTLALLDSTNTEVVTESTTAAALQLYRSGDTTNAVTLDAGTALVDLTCTVFDTITLSGSDLYLDLTALAVTLGDADAFSLTFTNGTLAAIDTDSLRIYATLDGEHYLAGYTTQQGGMAEKVYFTTSASVPEPATATLSLLALAALAARRRRK